MTEAQKVFGLAVGDRVELAGGHPWAGELGVVDRFETTAMTGPRPVVILDHGPSAFIMQAGHFRRVER